MKSRTGKNATLRSLDGYRLDVDGVQVSNLQLEFFDDNERAFTSGYPPSAGFPPHACKLVKSSGETP